MELERVLKAIGGWLDSRGWPHAVAGAVAMAAHGVARATLDLDLVVHSEAQKALVEMMEELGYETLYRSEGYSNHLHPDPEMGRVDFIYIDGATATKVFGARTQIRGLWAPKVEHLIAMKVHAIRNNPGRRLRDLADIQALAGLEGVDEQEVRLLFEKAGMLQDWNELFPKK